MSFALHITETKILYGTWLYAEVAALKDWSLRPQAQFVSF